MERNYHTVALSIATRRMVHILCVWHAAENRKSGWTYHEDINFQLFDSDITSANTQQVLHRAD